MKDTRMSEINYRRTSQQCGRAWWAYKSSKPHEERSAVDFVAGYNAALADSHAPEMLAALKQVRDVLITEYNSYIFNVNFPYINEAIRKAEGE
jgi:hypothetical protein